MKTSKAPIVFDSLAAAAGGLGIQKFYLSAWKAKGCPAFRGGRVYLDELRKWLKTSGQFVPKGMR